MAEKSKFSENEKRPQENIRNYEIRPAMDSPGCPELSGQTDRQIHRYTDRQIDTYTLTGCSSTEVENFGKIEIFEKSEDF